MRVTLWQHVVKGVDVYAQESSGGARFASEIEMSWNDETEKNFKYVEVQVEPVYDFVEPASVCRACTIYM